MEALGADPAAVMMLEEVDAATAGLEHDGLAHAYRSAGVEVFYVQPRTLPPPNQLFMADLFVMTPEGAILGRPASMVRAGEERWAAEALAEMGVPILRSVRGDGTFEGADLMWITPDTVLLAEGFRTNQQGAAQVKGTLGEMGIRTVSTELPRGTMHLMGQLRIVDRDLALVWRGRLPDDAVTAVETLGYRVAFLPDEEEMRQGFALNFVVLGPREILMPRGNPANLAFLEDLGIVCHTVQVSEIGKAAGSVGCLTGVVGREPTVTG